VKGFNIERYTKESASDRLKLILIHDRVNLEPGFLDMIKGEIVDIIAKYVEIDNSEVDVRLINSNIEDKLSVLVAKVSIKGYK